jgi:hypothetical protein
VQVHLPSALQGAGGGRAVLVDDDGDLRALGRARAKGDAQGHGQQHREHEHPEHRPGLAVELAQPRQGQLPQGMVRHRAGSAR